MTQPISVARLGEYFRPDFVCTLESQRRPLWPSRSTTDKIVVGRGFHDVTRLTTLRNSAMLDPSHPDTKARCAAMMNTPLYLSISLSYLSLIYLNNRQQHKI
jgi:hypothetical protein